MTGPIELAKDVWWVGATLADDSFQCHAYYLHNGDQSVLIDAGSALTLNETLSKVAAIAPLDSIAYLLCHHSDPDIAAGLPVLGEVLKRSDVRVITEWRAQALLQHYGHRFGYYLIEESGWRLPLNDEAVLEFQLPTCIFRAPSYRGSHQPQRSFHPISSEDLFPIQRCSNPMTSTTSSRVRARSISTTCRVKPCSGPVSTAFSIAGPIFVVSRPNTDT